jgi:signal transduction histidine kinase
LLPFREQEGSSAAAESFAAGFTVECRGAMSDVDAHRHRYRSPLAAIVGLSEAALLRDDLDEDLAKQLLAIRGLAQEALAADERREARRRRPKPGPPPDDVA